MFKGIKKSQKLPPFGKLVTEMLIFRISRSGVLKNFAILKPLSNKVADISYRTPTVTASEILRQLILFLS